MQLRASASMQLRASASKSRWREHSAQQESQMRSVTIELRATVSGHDMEHEQLRGSTDAKSRRLVEQWEQHMLSRTKERTKE
jgi:hypothetical protein